MPEIPAFFFNLDRRPVRLELIEKHLAGRGIEWRRIKALGASTVTMELVDAVAAPSGSPGAPGLGGGARTRPHRAA